MARRELIVPAAVSIALVGATLWPLVRDPVRGDSFPLSTYPMFAQTRPSTVTISYAIAETVDGVRRDLAPSHLGTGEVIQAFVIVDAAVARGRIEMRKLCNDIARRVAGDDGLADVVRIRIVTGQHATRAYLVDDAPGTVLDRERCEVRRPP